MAGLPAIDGSMAIHLHVTGLRVTGECWETAVGSQKNSRCFHQSGKGYRDQLKEVEERMDKDGHLRKSIKGHPGLGICLTILNVSLMTRKIVDKPLLSF